MYDIDILCCNSLSVDKNDDQNHATCRPSRLERRLLLLSALAKPRIDPQHGIVDQWKPRLRPLTKATYKLDHGR
jgi:hypothetical protein